MNVRTEASQSEDSEVAVVALDGEIDMSNASSLSDSIYSAVPPRALGVVIDLGQVRYLDSSGISLLFELTRTFSARRQQLTFCVPGDSPIKGLLKVANVGMAAPVLESVPAATAAARGQENLETDRKNPAQP